MIQQNFIRQRHKANNIHTQRTACKSSHTQASNNIYSTDRLESRSGPHLSPKTMDPAVPNLSRHGAHVLDFLTSHNPEEGAPKSPLCSWINPGKSAVREVIVRGTHGPFALRPCLAPFRSSAGPTAREMEAFPAAAQSSLLVHLRCRDDLERLGGVSERNGEGGERKGCGRERCACWLSVAEGRDVGRGREEERQEWGWNVEVRLAMAFERQCLRNIRMEAICGNTSAQEEFEIGF